MNDVFSTAIVLAMSALLLAVVVRRSAALERQTMAVAFVAHILAAAGQIAVTSVIYGGAGDMLEYMREATNLVRGFDYDPNRFGPLWVDLLLQRGPNPTLPITGDGTTTGSMVALTAVVAFVCRSSLWGSCLVFAMGAFFGQVALYRAFRPSIPQELRSRMLIAVFLMPSVLFWSSGVVKEAVVLAGMGPLWLGVSRLLRGKPVSAVLLIAIGAAPIALIKPYTLFALASAAGVWVALDRLHERAGRVGAVRIRPLYIFIGAGIVVGGVIFLGRAFPTYAVENLGNDLAHHQRVGQTVTGGSNYAIGDENAESLSRQLAFAPIGLITALFRPFLFEARNALALGAALEVTVLTVLLVRSFIRPGFRAVVYRVMSTPLLFASLVFMIAFGLAVGLATTNFGSLSRYRMPLIPFYGWLVFALSAQKTAAKKPLSPPRRIGEAALARAIARRAGPRLRARS